MKPKQFHSFLRWAYPTKSEFVIYLIVASSLVLIPLISQHLEAPIITSLENSLDNTFGAHTAGKISQVIFWASVGGLFYISYWAMVNFGSEVIEDVMATFAKKHSKRAVKRRIELTLLYSAVIAIFLEVGIIQLRLLFPVYTTLLHNLSSSFSALTMAALILTALIIAVSFHIYIVAIRIITKRSYIFKRRLS